MNQLKIAFIVLLIALSSSGCYTTVYNSVDGDVYNQQTTIIVPPTPPPAYYPSPPIILPAPVTPPPRPIEPRPPEYKTRPPENNGGNKKRDPGVVDPIRIGGERGNDEGRR
ncbi:MAG: hypothetical protein HKM87_03960 [Ignavibacteriaceae bacterium]|nr:hypothetical protein [Ignavibacteriaceae bacterium]